VAKRFVAKYLHCQTEMETKMLTHISVSELIQEYKELIKFSHHEKKSLLEIRIHFCLL
jgi:hypothetical protein